MIVTMDRVSLLDAVSRLQRVVSAKSAMPVLEGILFSAEQGKVTLASYNLEMGMKKELPARCEEDGDVVINARILADILRRMNGVQVEISADEKLLCHLKSEKAEFDIMGMASVDFPEMPSVSEGTRVTIDGKLFAEMTRQTLFSVAQSELPRPILTGLDISLRDNCLQMVAVDGIRMAIRREKADIEGALEFIVSGRAVGEAVKLIDENTESFEILVGKRLISFYIDGYSFISRLMEEEYVNYLQTIPKSFTQSVTVRTGELINTIERVSLLISDFFSSPVRCMFHKDQIVFSSATTAGRATESFPAELTGEPFEIGLNSRFLLEALRAIDDEKVTIRFNGVNAGVSIRPVDENQDDFFYLIMPMRMNNG